MADYRKIARFILSWEGGFVNDPKDRGGATNMGVTLKTWKSVGWDIDKDGDIDIEDLKLITKEDVIKGVMVPSFWNKIKGDAICSEPIAAILLDWAWMSGPVNVIRRIQRLLGVKDDGVVGPVTIKAINTKNAIVLFHEIKQLRVDFYYDIVRRDKSQSRFLQGWLNRLSNILYDGCMTTKGDFLMY